MKNRNPWFKVKPGDDARLFRDVDIETEGFIARLRRTAHDCEPYGFLVDHRQRPYDMKKIADILHLSNNRAGIAFAEARGSQLIQTAAEFRADLKRASAASKRVKNKLVIFDELYLELGDLPDTEVCLMPTLVEDYLDSEANRRFGRRGGNPELRLVESEVVNHPLNHGVNHPLKPEDKAEDKAQISEVRSQKSEEKKSPILKKEKISTTRAQEPMGENPLPTLTMQRSDAPWSWKKHLYLLDQYRKWRAKLPAEVFEDEAREASYFFAEFGFSIDLFRKAQEVYEHGPNDPPIPQSCIDDLHAFDPGTGRCANCDAPRIAEETA